MSGNELVYTTLKGGDIYKVLKRLKFQKENEKRKGLGAPAFLNGFQAELSCESHSKSRFQDLSPEQEICQGFAERIILGRQGP